MSWAKKVAKGFVYGMLTGTTFFMVGGVAAPYIPGLTPVIAAAIGFTGAFAIAAFPSENEE